MAQVSIQVSDRYAGDMSLDNSGKIEEINLGDNPYTRLGDDIDEVVDRVKAAYGIAPRLKLGTVKDLGAAIAYVAAQAGSLGMTEEELGQAVLARLAKS
jgi:hypothetical protein